MKLRNLFTSRSDDKASTPKASAGRKQPQASQSKAPALQGRGRATNEGSQAAGPKKLSSSYTPGVPSAQAFVTADAPFNAGAPIYLQSVMKKQQMLNQERADGLVQAAQRKAEAQRLAAAAPPPVEDPAWPQMPVPLRIFGRNLNDIHYQFLLVHLDIHQDDMKRLHQYHAIAAKELRIKMHKAVKHEVIAVGRRAARKMNEYLSGQWTKYFCVSYAWDAEIDEGAFDFFFPATRSDRLRWSQIAKGQYFTPADWAAWNERTDNLIALVPEKEAQINAMLAAATTDAEPSPSKKLPALPYNDAARDDDSCSEISVETPEFAAKKFRDFVATLKAVCAEQITDWPRMPKTVRVCGGHLSDPGYRALFAHLNFGPAQLSKIHEMHELAAKEVKVKFSKATKQDLLVVGRYTAKLMNAYLSQHMTTWVSLSYLWDAENDEGAFEFHYPQSYAAREAWAEQNKSEFWNGEDWARWERVREGRR